MRILANYGYKTNGDSFSVTFETMGDVPADKASGTVDELFRLAKEAVHRQVLVGDLPVPPAQVEIPRPAPGPVGGPPAQASGNGHGNGRSRSPKDPSKPATPKQLGLIRRLGQQNGVWVGDLKGLTMGEASEKIDELLAVRQ